MIIEHRVAKIHRDQRVVCVCRNGYVRSVGTRHLLNGMGFTKVIAVGWATNDKETLNSLFEWADVVIVVGQPVDWLSCELVNPPPHKTHLLEIGPDIYGHYANPMMLALIGLRLKEIVV